LDAVEWMGRRVTVMGLGRHGGGVAAARFLAQRGARVTISDVAERAALAESLAALDGVPIERIRLGPHDPTDFDADFVVVNPAVRPDQVCLAIARAAGARLISETELFLEHCPARVIGVTGSNGKSTTCSMLSAILNASGRRVWLGGNIGRSLLGEVGRISRDDWVVLELSSFQLAHLSPAARWPEIAVVTNCSPNHLDWHGSWDAYVAAKLRLVRQLRGDGVAVLDLRDPHVRPWSQFTAARVAESWPDERMARLAVPGEHNRRNAACAAAAAAAAGIEETSIARGLSSFTGLPHRLESVAEVAGRRFYNDSKATSPAATIAALDAIDGPIWLLAGGQSKGLDFQQLAVAVAARVRGVALFGAAREAMGAIFAKMGGFETVVVETLREAVAACWRRSRPGDAILLSPACASHDQFHDYCHRGEAFCELVRGLKVAEEGIATEVTEDTERF
jgi:UDP-N-acetylmuramoylalanine--D-glutamate ligase